MRYQLLPTEVSLRGSLCRDFLSLVASGMSANEAANWLISRLLTAPNSGWCIRRVSGGFAFAKRDDTDQVSSLPKLFQ
jgi:hypothetical protein